MSVRGDLAKMLHRILEVSVFEIVCRSYDPYRSNNLKKSTKALYSPRYGLYRIFLQGWRWY